MWTSDFSGYLSDAMASRMIMRLIPAQHYVLTADGVNLTLQAAMLAIVRSWNRLADEGVPMFDVPSRGGKVVPARN